MKIKVGYSEFVPVGGIKAVKAHAKELKPELENIVRESIEFAQKDLDIDFLYEITEARVTYYNSYQKPVVYVWGRATDSKLSPMNPKHWLFVEAFVSLDEHSCSANVYRKE